MSTENARYKSHDIRIDDDEIRYCINCLREGIELNDYFCLDGWDYLINNGSTHEDDKKRREITQIWFAEPPTYEEEEDHSYWEDDGGSCIPSHIEVADNNYTGPYMRRS